MTITPKQARELREEEKSELSRLEKRIDEALQKEFQRYSNQVIYPIARGREDTGMTQRVVEEIKRVYNQAGWNVNYESSQFDGEWLEFTPK